MTDKEIITCQKSQIEDLKEALEERIERIKVLEEEVNRLQGYNLRMARKHYDDGVREFAERLLQMGTPYFTYPNKNAELVTAVRIYEIDGLKKKMTEETDNGNQ